VPSLRYLVVANVEAGKTGDDDLDRALRTLERAAPTELVTCTSPDDLDEPLDRARDDDCVLVVAGGDGSLHLVVNRLFQRGALGEEPLGLVPLGTGNDFARGAGLPLEPEAAATVIVDGRPHEFDLLTTDGPPGEIVVNAAHAGLGAEAADAASAAKPVLGPLAYPIGALIAGVRETGWRLDVEVDGDSVTVGEDGDRLLMVGVANGPSIGGGTRLCPPARADDGQLDVVVVAATGPLARTSFARDLKRGTHLDRDDVTHRRGQRVVIRGEPLRHNADGELTDPIAARTYELAPRAWSLLMVEQVAPGEASHWR
jgi:YegS/Rv2252/BmrU family lipid kinase